MRGIRRMRTRRGRSGKRIRRGRSGKRSDQDKYPKNWLEMKGAAEEDGAGEKGRSRNTSRDIITKRCRNSLLTGVAGEWVPTFVALRSV